MSEISDQWPPTIPTCSRCGFPLDENHACFRCSEEYKARQRIAELEAQLAEARRPSEAVRELVEAVELLCEAESCSPEEYACWSRIDAALAAVKAQLAKEESNV